MALTTTTLSAAVNIYNTSFGVVSATGIVNPTYSAGSALQTGITYALCEEEMMQVTNVTGTVVSVLRGQYGSIAASHAASAPITFGLATDFPIFIPAIKTSTDSNPQRFATFSAPVAGAATNVATGGYFHLTGTVAMVNLTAPAQFVGGAVVIVFDGSAAGLTWTAAGNIAVAGTATTAASAVEFYFDPGTGKWHPSRLA